MSEYRLDRSRFRSLFSAKQGELWIEPLSERALRMHCLDILESQMLNGELSQWYLDPSGMDAQRTIAALEDVGAKELATELANVVGILDGAIGKRGELGPEYMFSDDHVELTDSAGAEFNKMFMASLLAERANFYKLAVDWWERGNAS